MPLVNRYMLPSEQESVYIDPALLQETTPKPTTITRPAQHLEQSKLLGMTIGLLGLASVSYTHLRAHETRHELV